jgi:hypothetical protein
MSFAKLCAAFLVSIATVTAAHASIIFDLTLTAPEAGFSGTGVLMLTDGTDLSGNYTLAASPVEKLTFTIGSYPTFDLTNSYQSISFAGGDLIGIQTAFGNFPSNYPKFPTYSASSNGLQYTFFDWLTSGGTQDGVISAIEVPDNNQVASAVPEASTWVMLLLGFAGIGTLAYRRRESVMA